MIKRGKFDKIKQYNKQIVSKYYRINQFIQAGEVRVVDETGKQIGVMPIFNAVQKARELGLDLIEVSANAKPPVCKIMDFKKFKYVEAKKEREEKRGQKGGDIKEIMLTPFIASNDVQTRIKKAKKFLEDNNKVKFRVKFRGAELGKKDFGFRLISSISEALFGFGEKEFEPKFMGRELFVIFNPVKGKK